MASTAATISITQHHRYLHAQSRIPRPTTSEQWTTRSKPFDPELGRDRCTMRSRAVVSVVACLRETVIIDLLLFNIKKA